MHLPENQAVVEHLRLTVSCGLRALSAADVDERSPRASTRQTAFHGCLHLRQAHELSFSGALTCRGSNRNEPRKRLAKRQNIVHRRHRVRAVSGMRLGGRQFGRQISFRGLAFVFVRPPDELLQGRHLERRVPDAVLNREVRGRGVDEALYNLGAAHLHGDMQRGRPVCVADSQAGGGEHEHRADDRGGSSLNGEMKKLCGQP
ncbi:hypothetical protein B0H11DRAFT_1965551 [Mycena galericulata]|nr:hypothetical protein B0H11DRAFT_1965551 [Mycena galericulata]